MEKNPLKSELSLPHSFKGVCYCVSDPTPTLVTILSHLVSGRILGMKDGFTMGRKVVAARGSPASTNEPYACHSSPLIGRCVCGDNFSL